MRFFTATLSEPGPRAENEDAIGVWTISGNRTAVAVADGLGGHFGGRVASQLALDEFGRFVQSGSGLNLLEEAKAIHLKIRKEQEAKPEYRSMATTLSAAIFSSGLMEFVHCGDSRIVLRAALA